MKVKITLVILLFLFLIKLQAQTPSINESKSTSIKDPSFNKMYIDVLDKKIQKIEKQKSELVKHGMDGKTLTEKDKKEINEKDTAIAALNADKKKIADSDEEIIYRKYFERILERKTDSIAGYYEAMKQPDLTLKDLDSIRDLIKKKDQEKTLLTQQMEKRLEEIAPFQNFFPTTHKLVRKRFFHDMYNNKKDTPTILNAFALNNNSDATSVQTELITDNLGPIRLSLGNVLSVASEDEDSGQTPAELNKTETEQEAFGRLINGGGNFYLDAILPVYTTNQANSKSLTVYSYVNVRGAMDVKSFGSDIDSSTANGSLGLNLYAGLSSDSKKFNFFIQGNANYTAGTNDFYKNLGLNYEKPFLNGKIITGVTVLNQLRFSAIITAFGSDEKIRNNKIVVGVQILPGI